jgi:hypothetical protein
VTTLRAQRADLAGALSTDGRAGATGRWNLKVCAVSGVQSAVSRSDALATTMTTHRCGAVPYHGNPDANYPASCQRGAISGGDYSQCRYQSGQLSEHSRVADYGMPYGQPINYATFNCGQSAAGAYHSAEGRGPEYSLVSANTWLLAVDQSVRQRVRKVARHGGLAECVKPCRTQHSEPGLHFSHSFHCHFIVLAPSWAARRPGHASGSGTHGNAG